MNYQRVLSIEFNLIGHSTEANCTPYAMLPGIKRKADAQMSDLGWLRYSNNIAALRQNTCEVGLIATIPLPAGR